MEKKWGQVDKVESSLTTYNWEIQRFDRKLIDLNIENLVSESFSAGEDVGIKSMWHVEIEEDGGSDSDDDDGEIIEVDRKGLKVTLVFEKCVGGTESKMPFMCHTWISLHHCDTSFANYRITPEMKIMGVKADGEKHVFTIDHRQLYGRDSSVEENVYFSINLEIFGKGTKGSDGGFGLAKLQTDFEQLFKSDEDSSDFTIECDRKTFKVHKTILRARSTVFAAMLNNKDFKESQTNTLVVEDIDQTTMEILLHYIYTGKLLTELKNSNVLEPVIRGAEKYDLVELKHHCFHRLTQSITVENFGSIVVLAHTVRAEEETMLILKNYYLRNVLSLMRNSGFRTLAAQHLDIIFDD